MDNLILIGKKRTIILCIALLIISAYTIVSYHIIALEINLNKLFLQILRFALTTSLLLFVYKGKRWAMYLLLILLSLSLVGIIVSLSITDIPILNYLPLFIMAIVYTISIFHFGFSKSFKAFFEYKNSYVPN